MPENYALPASVRRALKLGQTSTWTRRPSERGSRTQIAEKCERCKTHYPIGTINDNRLCSICIGELIISEDRDEQERWKRANRSRH